MRFTFVILLFCGLGADAQMIIKAHANYRPYAVAAQNLLLDDYPNAAAAYSLRKLDKDYTGSAIRVRRSNDNAEQDIGFTSSGDLDTASLKTFVGAGNNGFVTVWYDQSSSNKNIFNTTAAQQPTIIDLGTIQRQNNKPCIVFGGGGTNQFIKNDTMKLPLINRSVFFVMRQLSIRNFGDEGFFGLNPPSGSNDFNTTSAYEFQGQNPGASRQYGAFGSAGVSYQLQKNGTSNVSLQILTPYSLLSEIKGGSSASLYENGNLITTDNSFTEFASQSHGGFIIGARYFTNLSVQFNTNSSFQEFIYWGANQSSNRTGIQNNINDYYNIYWNGDFAGLLDSFPSSAAAYSLRNLDKDYLGPLVRVRRSSDNAEQDIFGDYYGNLDTVGLKNFVGANSGFVTTWYDQSGNARNATQTTAAQQPRIVNAGVVDRDGTTVALNFNGSNKMSTTTFLNGFNQLSLFSVANFLSANFFEQLYNSYENVSGKVGFLVRRHDVLNALQIFAAASTVSAIDNYNNNNINNSKILISILRNSTSFISYINNTAGTTTNIINSNYNSTVSDIGGSSEFFQGRLQELIFYTSDQSSNRTGIQNNTNTYYSIY